MSDSERQMLENQRAILLSLQRLEINSEYEGGSTVKYRYTTGDGPSPIQLCLAATAKLLDN